MVPFPWSLSAPVVKEYQKNFVAHAGNDNFNFSSLEGYIAAKVFVEGLAPRRAAADARKDLSRRWRRCAISTSGGFNVTYTPTDHNGSKFVELTVIGRDGRFLR